MKRQAVYELISDAVFFAVIIGFIVCVDQTNYVDKTRDIEPKAVTIAIAVTSGYGVSQIAYIASNFVLNSLNKLGGN